MIIKFVPFRPPLSLGYKTEKRKKRIPTLREALIRETWQNIEKKFNPVVPESTRIAIVEADACVDDVLRQLGFEGEHFADRLARLEPEGLSTLPALWRAHKVRNDLVHTPGFTLGADDAEAIMNTYKDFLIELGVLREEEFKEIEDTELDGPE